MITNYVTSLIRTWVPIAVGAVLAYFHVTLPAHAGATAASIATAAVAAGFYGLVRIVEHYVPQAGWLLGSPAAPDYGKIAKEAVEDLGVVTFDQIGVPAEVTGSGAAVSGTPPAAAA